MFARVVLLLWIALAAAGCYPASGPDLVTLSELTPATVARGDRLALVGSGFPEGKRAEIVLSGTIHSPGAEPYPVRRTAVGRSTDSEHVEWTADDAFVVALSGAESSHSTFRGDIRVWFEAATPAAPRVTGVLRAVTLDLYRTRRADAPGKTRQSARPLWRYLGLGEVTPLSPGLRLDTLSPESALLDVGLASGDILLEANGVRLLEPGDLVPAPQAGMLRLRFARPPSREPYEVDVDLRALQPTSPAELLPVAAIAAAALALLLALVGPLGKTLAWFERTARLRSEPIPSGSRSLRTLLALLLPSAFSTPASRWASFVAFLAVGAGFTAVSAKMPISGSFDLPVVFGMASFLLIVGGVVMGGARAGRWSLRAGLGAGVRRCLQAAVGAVGLAGAAMMCSTFSLEQFVAEQGGWPWEYAAFSNPGILVLAVITTLSAVPDGAQTTGPFFEVRAAPPVAVGGSFPRWALIADRAYVFSVAALVTTVFLGGWQLPPSSALPDGVRLVLGGAVFQLKYCSVAMWVLVARELSARASMELLTGIAFTRLLPSAGLAFLAAFAYERWQGASDWDWLTPLIGPVLLTVCASFSMTALVRLHRSLTRSAGGPAVNPWI